MPTEQLVIWLFVGALIGCDGGEEKARNSVNKNGNFLNTWLVFFKQDYFYRNFLYFWLTGWHHIIRMRQRLIWCPANYKTQQGILQLLHEFVLVMNSHQVGGKTQVIQPLTNKYLLCTCQILYECFAYINSFTSHYKAQKQALILSPFQI